MNYDQNIFFELDFSVLFSIFRNNVFYFQVNYTTAQQTERNDTINRTVYIPPPLIEYRQFDWNEKEQGSILGSFFWLHWVTQIPGGILAAKYGTKKVYGITNFLGAVCSFAIPFCADQNSLYLIIIRTMQGFICVSKHQLFNWKFKTNDKALEWHQCFNNLTL